VAAAFDYSRWSAHDWVRHYAGPRFHRERAEVGGAWDERGRWLPRYGTGQVSFEDLGLRPREFPLGFYDPAVPPVCYPATAAQITGTVSLSTSGLYGVGGSLDSTALAFTIDGGAPIPLGFGVVANEVALLALINAAINPLVTASADPITGDLVLTTAATGSGASLLVTGSAVGPLGLPFPPVTFTGTDTAPGVGARSVISRSQLRGFRGERLVIPADIAMNFSVRDIKVGNRSQLGSSVAIPAETFAEPAVDVRLSLDTAITAMDIALVVTNLTSAVLPFRGTLIGTTFA
jgi:hypothetical protein